MALRRKLERSEQSCSELRQNTEKLESKVGPETALCSLMSKLCPIRIRVAMEERCQMLCTGDLWD